MPTNKLTPALAHWRPIETAPRDGTVILVACWNSSKWPCDRRWLFWQTRWVHADNGYVGWQAIGHGWPTHWCPLPETKRKQKDYCRRWSKLPCPPSA